MIKPLELTNVQYTRTTSHGGGTVGDISQKAVIATSAPCDTYTVVDVTDLDQEKRQMLVDSLNEYNEYKSLMMSQIFSFETWLEHTNSSVDPADVKWRKLKADNTEVVDPN